MSVEPENLSDREWPCSTIKGLKPKCGHRQFNKFEYFCKYVWCCGWLCTDKLWCSRLSSEILVAKRMVSFCSMHSIQTEKRACQKIKDKSKDNLELVKTQRPYENKGIIITNSRNSNKSDAYIVQSHRTIRFKDAGTMPRGVSNAKPIKDNFRMEEEKRMRKERREDKRDTRRDDKRDTRRDDKRDTRRDEGRTVPTCARNPESMKPIKRCCHSPNRNLSAAADCADNSTPRKHQSRKDNPRHHSDGLSRHNIITVPKSPKKPSYDKERHHRSKRHTCCRTSLLESRLQMIFIKCNPVMRRRAISFVNKPALRRIPANPSQNSSSSSSDSKTNEKSSMQKFRIDSQNPITKIIKKIFSSGNKCNETSDGQDSVRVSQSNVTNRRGSACKEGNYTCCVLDPRKTTKLHKPSTSTMERKSILKQPLPIEEPVQSQGRIDISENDIVQTTHSESNHCQVPNNSFRTETVTSEERVLPKGKPISSRLFGWLFESKFTHEPTSNRDSNCLDELNQNTRRSRMKVKEPVTTIFCSILNPQMRQPTRSSKLLAKRSNEASPCHELTSTSKPLLAVRKSVLSLKCIFLSEENSIQNTKPICHGQNLKPNISSGVAQCVQNATKKASQCNNSKGNAFLSLFRECLGKKSKRNASDVIEENQVTDIGPLSGRNRFMACDGNTNIRQSSSKPKMLANVFTASSNSNLSSSESVLSGKWAKRYNKKPTIFQVMICKLGNKFGHKPDKSTVSSQWASAVSGVSLKVAGIATVPNISIKDNVERPLVIKDSSYVIQVEKEIVLCPKISRPGEVIPQKPEGKYT